MAKGDVNFQQMMSAPETPVHISQGVSKPASALPEILGTVAEAAVGTYEGLQFRDQREKQNDAIQQFENYMDIEDISMDELAGQRNAADSIWKQYESQVVDPDTEALNKLEETYGKSIEKLKRAQEQGIMNDSEFLARITKITREAVNKNPWMEGQLYSAAQTHLKAMGISDLLDTRAKQVKDIGAQQDEARKFYRGAFKENNMLDKFDPNASEAVWQSQLEEIQTQKFGLENGRMLLEKEKQMDEVIMRRVLSGKGQEFNNQDIANTVQDAIVELEANPANVDAVISSLKVRRDDRIRQYKAGLGTNLVTEQGKAFMSSLTTDWDSAIQTLEAAGTGKVGTERMKNLLAAKQAEQELKLRDIMNVDAVNQAIKVVTPFDTAIKDLLYKGGMPAVTSSLGLVAKLLGRDDVGTTEMNALITSGSANSVFTGILSHQEGFSNRDGRVALVRTAEAINNQILSGRLTAEQGLPAVNGMLKTISENSHLMSGIPMAPEFTQQIVKSVDISMTRSVPELMNVISKVAGPDDNIELDVLPNGAFVINTGDPVADEKFNRKFSNQINNALDSYAAASGKSREKVAPEFYERYLKNYVAQDPELKMLTPSELNIQSPREAKAALDTGRITQEQYDAIVKEGFN
jgi:hypothetical protein